MGIYKSRMVAMAELIGFVFSDNFSAENSKISADSGIHRIHFLECMGMGPPILKLSTFSTCSLKSFGHKLSNEVLGSPLASILSERRAVTLLRGGGHGKLQKSAFFASFASPRKFCEEKFYQDRTM